MAKLSPLAQRVVTALFGVPVLVGVCLWGALPFTVFTVVLALIGRAELLRAYTQAGIHPNRLLALVGALAPGAVFVLSRETLSAPLPLLLILACSLVAASLWETGVASHTKSIETGKSLAYGLLCGAYLSLFGGLTLLRISHWPSGQSPRLALESGAALVLLTLSCTITTDSAAFFVGRWLGRHRLAEGLSPKKTTEGLVGGALGSVLVGAGMGWLLLGHAPFGAVVGGLAGLLGPLGDLFKSALKRELGIKDFGALLPGHGGVLDRFDSVLFTAPVVVLLVTNASGRLG